MNHRYSATVGHPKPTTEVTKEQSHNQAKTKTHHGGTETRRKTGENQLHRGGAEKNLISIKNLRKKRGNLGLVIRRHGEKPLHRGGAEFYPGTDASYPHTRASA